MNTKIKLIIKRSIFLILAVLVYLLITELLNIGCIFYSFSGIPCLGCGITRSAVELLHFNFKLSFEYHAFTILICLAFYYFVVIEPVFPLKNKWFKIFLGVLFLILLIYYIYRLFFCDTDIIFFNFKKSILYEIYSFITNMV